MQKEKSCGAIIYRDNVFLLTRDRKSQRWGFPIGHVEEGETEEETALREISEEAGLAVALVPGFREEFVVAQTNGAKKIIVLFLAKALSKQLTCADDEIDAYAWLSYEPAMTYLGYPENEAPLSKAYAFISSLENRPS
jgi:bis(5'-nucleosidyl)-tetraphosphatase